MCLDITIIYPQCGHSGKKNIRRCNYPSTCVLRHASEYCPILEGIYRKHFCPQCYLLPDPRVSQLERFANSSRWIEKLLTRPRRDKRALDVWTRAKEHGIDFLFLDIHVFLSENFHPPCKDVKIAISKLWTLLDKDIWWRILHSELPQPTKEERLFVLQIRSVIEACRTQEVIYCMLLEIAKEKLGRWGMQQRMNALITPVSPADIDPEAPNCPICLETFRGADNNLQGEAPVQTRLCKHVFGEKCLHTWLSHSTSCPMCRATLSSNEDRHRLRRREEAERDLERTYRLRNHRAEQAAEQRGSPTWLRTLMGSDVGLFLPSAFTSRWRRLRTVYIAVGG